MDQFLLTIIMLGVLGGVFYFFLMRPQQRRMKEQQEKLASIDVGTRVMLTSGIFGTVRHRGDKQLILEVAPGMEITVVKQAIMKIVDSSEEEFEYEDDTADGVDVEIEQDVTQPTNEEIAAFFQEETTSSADDDKRTEEPGSDDSPSK